MNKKILQRIDSAVGLTIYYLFKGIIALVLIFVHILILYAFFHIADFLFPISYLRHVESDEEVIPAFFLFLEHCLPYKITAIEYFLGFLSLMVFTIVVFSVDLPLLFNCKIKKIRKEIYSKTDIQYRISSLYSKLLHFLYISIVAGA